MPWRKLLSLNPSEPRRSSGPTHVLRIMPGMEHRDHIALLLHSWAQIKVGTRWPACVQLAPILPLPPHGRLLPAASEVFALPAPVGGVTVVSHTDGEDGLLR